MQPEDFERWPPGQPLNETDIAVRAYITRIPAEKLAQYEPAWSDEQVMAWDGNFRSDGELMLVCCEDDVDVRKFRRLVEAYRRLSAEAPSTSL